MVFDITYLKKIRKQLNLTQHQFAKEAQISQSMVAKIESGKLDPTYSYVKKIEQALESMLKQQEQKAKDIMNKRVIAIKKEETIGDIAKIFLSKNISQAPVVDKNIVMGLITESLLLDNKDATKKASEVMTESPPIIAPNTKLSVITQLLKFYPILLVNEAGKLAGVITKADIIKNLA